MADANIRETMNQGEAGRLADLDRDIKIGDVMNALITAMTATEAGVAVTGEIATLANVPSSLLDCKVATVSSGSATGSKLLRKVSAAFLTANNPAAGECFWDGALRVRFASADDAATADFRYTRAATATVSCLQRQLGQQDG